MAVQPSRIPALHRPDEVFDEIICSNIASRESVIRLLYLLKSSVSFLALLATARTTPEPVPGNDALESKSRSLERLDQ